MAHIFRFIGSRSSDGWVLDESEIHHMRVVGIKDSDTVELIDGNGLYEKACVSKISGKNVYLDPIGDTFKSIPKPSLRLNVVTGLLKNSQDLLSSITEVGVDSIHLFCQLHNKKDFTPRLLHRFTMILRSATKQSKRYFIPDLHIYPSFKDCIDSLKGSFKDSRKILLDESSSTCLLNLDLTTNERLYLFTGSELGFSTNEQDLLNQLNPERYNLGSFILRSQTATLTATSIINLKFDS